MKPRVAFVGRLAGIVLCRCGQEMKKHGDVVYECRNDECPHRGKRMVAVISNAVLFYEVEVQGT